MRSILEILSRRKKGSIISRSPYGRRKRGRLLDGWEAIMEERLREQHPPLQDAWEQYQMLLKMYKIEEGIESEDPLINHGENKPGTK